MDKQQPQSADTLGIRQVWMEIKRRKLMVIAIMIMGIGATYAYTASQRVLYRSTASLLIENFVPTATQLANQYGDSIPPDVIKANRILAESRPVRDRCFALALEALNEKEISTDLEMQAHTDGQLLYLQVLDTKPERAAAYSNAWSDAFVEEMKKRALDPIIYMGSKYKELVPQMYTDWQTKLTALDNFRKEKKFNQKDYDLNFFNEKLKPLSAKLDEKKAVLIDLKAEQRYLDSKKKITYDDLKAVQSSKDDPELNAYRLEVETCRTKLHEAREKFQESHDEVKAKLARLNDAQAELDAAAGRYAIRLVSMIRIYDEERAGLQSEYDDLERKKDSMSALYGEWEKLHKDAEDAEKVYSEHNASMINMDFSSKISFTYAKPWERGLETKTPYLPSWKRNLAAGAFLSLLLAVLSVIGLDKLDDTVRTPKDLQRKPGINSMGMIPADPDGLTDADGYTLVLHKSFSVVAEALRNLHIGLEVKYGAHRTGQPLVVTVTSALANEGKSMVSSNLALLFAGLGRKVLIVDADLRKRSLSKVYKCDEKVGLRDIMQGTPWSPSMAVPGTIPGFFLLPAGNARPDSSDTIQPESFERALAQMKPGYDVIIFDTPPVLPMADACIMGQVSDVTILVVRSRRTSLRQVETASSNLMTANVKEIGCVVNGVDNDDASAGAYIYGYGYGYGYGLEPEKHRDGAGSRERSGQSRAREKVRE